jgi:aryl-alcohol dehydrogenase-like predicted oxidoreductase
MATVSQKSASASPWPAFRATTSRWLPRVGRLLRVDAPPDESQLSGGFGRWPAAPPVNPIFDFSYDGVLRSVEESLERLGLDRADVLHVHDPDEYEAASRRALCTNRVLHRVMYA